MAKEAQLQAAQKAAQDAIALNDAYKSARKLAGQDTVDNLSHDFGTQASERVLSENTVNAFVDAVNKLLVFANNHPDVEVQKKCAEQAVKFLQRASEIYQENAGEIDNRLISIIDELNMFEEGKTFEGAINRGRHYLGIAEKQFVDVDSLKEDMTVSEMNAKEEKIVPASQAMSYAIPALTDPDDRISIDPVTDDEKESDLLDPSIFNPPKRTPRDSVTEQRDVSDELKAQAESVSEVTKSSAAPVQSVSVKTYDKEVSALGDALNQPPLKWYQRVWNAVKRFFGFDTKSKIEKQLESVNNYNLADRIAERFSPNSHEAFKTLMSVQPKTAEVAYFQIRVAQQCYAAAHDAQSRADIRGQLIKACEAFKKLDAAEFKESIQPDLEVYKHEAEPHDVSAKLMVKGAKLDRVDDPVPPAFSSDPVTSPAQPTIAKEEDDADDVLEKDAGKSSPQP